MPISKPIPPETASAAVTSRLASLERAKGRSLNLEAGGGILANPGNCLPVYHIDSGSLSEPGMSIADAKPVGWQYLVGQGAEAKSVEVIGDKALAVDRGQVAHDIARALDIAEGKASDANYEARMLTFGRVGNPVLWLHPAAGGADRFFSLGPDPGEIEPARAMSKAMATTRVRQIRRSNIFESTDDETGG